tara:strand:- start:3058 stop:3453 length:396 start_codon:yes stop_codon:yes gene_type:complete
MPIPSDEKLYSKIKLQVYKKYPKHSAYRSGHLVKEYKKAFKEHYGPRKKPYKGIKPKKEEPGLKRWFAEDWKSDTNNYFYKDNSSVYRPTKRISKKTPITWSELTKTEITNAKKEKKQTGRVKRFKKSKKQ